MKGFCDYIFAVIFLIILSPLILLIASIYYLFYSGNPFFTQERIGRSGKSFEIYKFRTCVLSKLDDRGGLALGKLAAGELEEEPVLVVNPVSPALAEAHRLELAYCISAKSADEV